VEDARAVHVHRRARRRQEQTACVHLGEVGEQNGRRFTVLRDERREIGEQRFISKMRECVRVHEL
jgi:hypothetical protein